MGSKYAIFGSDQATYNAIQLLQEQGSWFDSLAPITKKTCTLGF